MNELAYHSFLERKRHQNSGSGFEPIWFPEKSYDFQKYLANIACRKGRFAVFADCGLGKTLILFTWAENIARKTGKRVLVLAPLAVAFQSINEATKFGIEAVYRRHGIEQGDRIVVTNYEMLDRFSPSDFAGVVCDESSILKNFDGKIRSSITIFMRKIEYRLLCTATAAPNDYIELGTSSEALGYLGSQDMINKFFKKQEKTTSARHEHMSGIYQLRPHAHKDFWRWVCSWSVSVRKPSDIGFSDHLFSLPPLYVNSHVVDSKNLIEGFLFDIPAVGLAEQRKDLARTINERCEMSASLVDSNHGQSIVWCNLNKEAELLKRIIHDAVEVNGNDSVDFKEESFRRFVDGDVKVLITKPTIGGFGLNLQNCAHQTFFPSHSFEQFYQCTRRSWRFGQKNPVTIDMITTKGQENVLKNLEEKSRKSMAMFDSMVNEINNSLIVKNEFSTTRTEVPSWL